MASDVTAEITNIYRDRATQKYHLNYLKVYMPRPGKDQAKFTHLADNEIEYKLDRMMLDIDQRAISFTGQPGARFLDLTEPFLF
jgi:hypothetical protein